MSKLRPWGGETAAPRSIWVPCGCNVEVDHPGHEYRPSPLFLRVSWEIPLQRRDIPLGHPNCCGLLHCGRLHQQSYQPDHFPHILHVQSHDNVNRLRICPEKSSCRMLQRQL